MSSCNVNEKSGVFYSSFHYLYIIFQWKKVDFQHAYKEVHSTCTALMEKINSWLSDTDSNKMAGAALLDFSAVCDLTDHEVLSAAYFNILFDNWKCSFIVFFLNPVWFIMVSPKEAAWCHCFSPFLSMIHHFQQSQCQYSLMTTLFIQHHLMKCSDNETYDLEIILTGFLVFPRLNA